MDLITLIADLGLNPWILTISVILILLQVTGLLKPLVEGLKDIVNKVALGIAYLFNKRYATQQQTIQMTDKLFNLVADMLDKCQAVNKENSERLTQIEYQLEVQTEIKRDLDTILHELDQKHASEIRLLQTMARSIERLSKDNPVSKND